MRIARLSDDEVASAVSAWNETLVHDPVTEQEFRRVVLQDPNYEPEAVRIARADDGSVIGLAGCVVRRTVVGNDGGGREEGFRRGYLKAFFVADHPAGPEAAGQLLERAESYCAEAEKAELYVTEYAGPYFFPGLDVRYQRLREVLVEHGYRDTRTIEDVKVSLKDPAVSTRLERTRQRVGTSVELLTWRPELRPEMRRFVEEGQQRQWFPVGWEDRWTDPRPRSLLLRKGTEIIGWADYHARVPRASFGPTLVLPRERGRGYGALLLLECMTRARDEGSQTMWAGWANTGFYVACGWHISRRYAVLVKEL